MADMVSMSQKRRQQPCTRQGNKSTVCARVPTPTSTHTHKRGPSTRQCGPATATVPAAADRNSVPSMACVASAKEQQTDRAGLGHGSIDVPKVIMSYVYEPCNQSTCIVHCTLLAWYCVLDDGRTTEREFTETSTSPADKCQMDERRMISTSRRKAMPSAATSAVDCDAAVYQGPTLTRPPRDSYSMPRRWHRGIQIQSDVSLPVSEGHCIPRLAIGHGPCLYSTRSGWQQASPADHPDTMARLSHEATPLVSANGASWSVQSSPDAHGAHLSVTPCS